MSIVNIFLIAIGLSMDCFAVSIANGMVLNDSDKMRAYFIASLFAFFHILMITIGWLVGSLVYDMVVQIDHWIAFGLLFFIGVKMIFDAKSNSSCDEDQVSQDPRSLLVQAIATSLDALAIGIGFALIQISIIWAMSIIGIVVFIISLIGIQLGKVIGKKIKQNAEIFGGIILILIGLKILIQHLYL